MKHKWKRIALWASIIIGLILVGTAGWLGYSTIVAKNKIITKNSGGGSALFQQSGAISPDQLTGDTDGRVNILLMGVGGESHPGGTLTDTIQVLSIDTQNHKAAMLSVPRDLYVKIPGFGSAKINSASSFGEQQQKGSGPNVLKETVSTLLDLPIHYYVQIDFDGFKKIIDSLGGITVTVDKALIDPYYPAPDMIRYAPINIKAGTQTMNGDIALKYARSRETTSDFDRSRRQQIVMQAMKEKALSLGILTNPIKINEMITIAGNHIRTDLQTNEITALAKEIKSIDGSQIITKVLDTAADGPLVGGDNGDGRGWIITPRNGDYSYASLQTIAREIFTNPFLAKENSKIALKNATGVSGLGNKVSALLKTYGYNVSSVTNNTTKEDFSQLIDYSNGKNPFTISFLEKRFKLKAQKLSPDAATLSDIVIIIGADYQTQGLTK
jgi:LCP family protein required for cell wall assembly